MTEWPLVLTIRVTYNASTGWAQVADAIHTHSEPPLTLPVTIEHNVDKDGMWPIHNALRQTVADYAMIIAAATVDPF